VSFVALQSGTALRSRSVISGTCFEPEQPPSLRFSPDRRIRLCAIDDATWCASSSGGSTLRTWTALAGLARTLVSQQPRSPDPCPGLATRNLRPPNGIVNDRHENRMILCSRVDEQPPRLAYDRVHTGSLPGFERVEKRPLVANIRHFDVVSAGKREGASRSSPLTATPEE